MLFQVNIIFMKTVNPQIVLQLVGIRAARVRPNIQILSEVHGKKIEYVKNSQFLAHSVEVSMQFAFFLE